MFLIVNGDPLDGFSYWGPFETADAATAWANREIKPELLWSGSRSTWWVSELEEPNEFDGSP
jgi:hypothetical protein